MTAPVISSAEIVATGNETANVTFNTDSTDGTAYYVVQLAADAAPNATQVKSGIHGEVSGQQVVTAGGPQMFNVIGLSPATTYLAYVVHTDAAGNDSPVLAALGSAETSSDVAQSWTNGGYETFTPNGVGFYAEKTNAGGSDNTYSNAYIDTVNGVDEEITLVFGASTTVTAVQVALSTTTNTRSAPVTIDPSGGGTYVVTVTPTVTGTLSVLIRVVTIMGVVELTSASSGATVGDPGGGGDVTAPGLSSVTAAANGAFAYTSSVSTDEDNGTLYWLVNENSSAPTSATVKAANSQAVSATGVQNVSGAGLTAATTYYIHYVHTDLADNDSAAVTSTSFTTGAVSAGRNNVLVIGVGQSLMGARGSSPVQESGGSAEMAVGGVAVTRFPSISTNVQFPPAATDWASLVSFDEDGAQSPMAGIANTLTGYTNVVLHTVAIGARLMEVLASTSYTQLHAAVYQGVERLVEAGASRDDIDIIFVMKHGEADAAANHSNAYYTEQFSRYIKRIRLDAARSLDDPTYVAKVHMTVPVSNAVSASNSMLSIKRALMDQADTLGGFYVGENWSVPMEADRVHPTGVGYVYGGERAGHQIVNEYQGLRCVSCDVSGTNFTATFSKTVVRDDTVHNKGGNLNTANAEDGIEFWDGTQYIAISNLVYSGNTITGDLASVPASGELRIALQAVTGALTSDGPNHVGCYIRSTDAGFDSVYNSAYRHYDWCLPDAIIANIT